MESPSTPSPGWTCPSCGRRVPRRVDECRCGLRQMDAPADAEPILPAAVAASSSGRGMWLLVLGLAAGALAMVPMRSMLATSAVPPTRQAAPTTVDATRVAATAPGDAPAVALPGYALDAAATPSVVIAAPAPTSLEDIVSSVVPAVET
jgi:hypothetical protein